MHDPELRDNPPSGLPIEQVTRPFDMQVKQFNQSHTNILAFLERIRATIDEYPDRFTVAEVGGSDPLAEMKAFTAGGKRLDSAYNFDFLYAEDLTAPLVRRSLEQWEDRQGVGWPSWAFSNHDAPRAINRWSNGKDAAQIARLNMLLLCALRGNPIIYQGEELGLPQGHVAFDDLLDPEAIANWPHTLGRDGARTPIPWTADAPHAGFSDANATWLKLDPAHASYSVREQANDPNSMATYTRRLLARRSALPALIGGSSTLLGSPDEIVAFVRTHPAGDVLCAFNLSDDSVEWQSPLDCQQAAIIASDQTMSSGGRIPHILPRRSGYWALCEGPGASGDQVKAS